MVWYKEMERERERERDYKHNTLSYWIICAAGCNLLLPACNPLLYKADLALFPTKLDVLTSWGLWGVGGCCPIQLMISTITPTHSAISSTPTDAC
mmetsp:Transcript_147724/g.258258  ORF Transcript_147724/g.258258 Transcript_147724/m.258258 type:complete len:95 (+) Transcript_147724:412-696(+)